MTEMDENMEKSSETEQNKVHQCLGPNRSNPVFSTENEFTCILCQEEEELKIEGKFLTKNWTKNLTKICFFFYFSGKALVTAAFLQKSTVLSNRRQQNLDGQFSARFSNAIEPSLPLMTSGKNFRGL